MGNHAQEDSPGNRLDHHLDAGNVRLLDHDDEDDARQSPRTKPTQEQFGVPLHPHSRNGKENGRHPNHSQAENGIDHCTPVWVPQAVTNEHGAEREPGDHRQHISGSLGALQESLFLLVDKRSERQTASKRCNEPAPPHPLSRSKTK